MHEYDLAIEMSMQTFGKEFVDLELVSAAMVNSSVER
jgi:hypothetical protein